MKQNRFQLQRRTALKSGLASGLGIAGVLAAPKIGTCAVQENNSIPQESTAEPNASANQATKDSTDNQSISKDRQAILAAGMTEAEADCWEQIAKAAGLFFQLPELHPTDNAEVATAIHVIQNKLLSRPTYRKYLKFHKANPSKKKN